MARPISPTRRCSPRRAPAADGVITSGHWAPSLDNAANKAFLAEFKQATGKEGDLNSMHGHDALTVMALALEKVKGD